jgi:hypothetical protein
VFKISFAMVYLHSIQTFTLKGRSSVVEWRPTLMSLD